jgi:RNA polymerase sigma-70 factor (ECF subfamily)
MLDAPTLCAVFLASAPEGRCADSAGDLEQILADLVQRGRTAWPELALPAPVFVRHLAAHAARGGSAREALSELCVEDLYLACSCAHGAPSAIATFERHLLSRVPGFLARMTASPSFVDEIKQELRIKLLVPTSGAAPKIAEYSGRGALASWLRVVALRAAIDVRRRSHDDAPPREAPGANDGERGSPEAIDVAGDPELRYLRDRYATEFQDAFRAGIHALSSEKRNVLRLNFVDGLNIDQIGALLHVHRATVARWIAAARQAIVLEGQRLLRERLGVSPGEFESLARLLQSQLDVSLTGLFAEEQGAPPAAKGERAPHDRA